MMNMKEILRLASKFFLLIYSVLKIYRKIRTNTSGHLNTNPDRPLTHAS